MKVVFIKICSYNTYHTICIKCNNKIYVTGKNHWCDQLLSFHNDSTPFCLLKTCFYQVEWALPNVALWSSCTLHNPHMD